VDQVILIGDAAPNTKEEILSKRAGFTGFLIDYWKNSWVKNVRHYSEELKDVSKYGIPVNAFYVEKWAETEFKEIAKKTNG
jgi:hypothetical protein